MKILTQPAWLHWLEKLHSPFWFSAYLKHFTGYFNTSAPICTTKLKSDNTVRRGLYIPIKQSILQLQYGGQLKQTHASCSHVMTHIVQMEWNHKNDFRKQICFTSSTAVEKLKCIYILYFVSFLTAPLLFWMQTAFDMTQKRQTSSNTA